jgi:hypothetical protein
VTELSRELAHDLTQAQLGSFLAPQWFDVTDQAEAGLGIWSELDVSGQELLRGTTWPAVQASVRTRSGDVTLVAGHTVPPVPTSADAWEGDLRVRSADTLPIDGTDHRALLVSIEVPGPLAGD